MVRSDADLSYINQVRVAHRARDIVYRAGPGHKVQTIVPSVPHPSPESCVIQSIRPTIQRSDACLDLHAVHGCVESRDTEEGSEANKDEDAETSHVENQTSNHIDHVEERSCQSQVQICPGEDRPGDSGLFIGDSEERKGEDIVCGGDGGKDNDNRTNCATKLTGIDDEDPLCEDSGTRGPDLETSSTRWSNCNNELETPQESRPTTLQLRIKEKMLKLSRHAVTGKLALAFLIRKSKKKEDGILEMILELME